MRKSMIPKFEADYKCQVITLAGATLSNLAALRATRGNPTYSAMCMDDVGVTQAKLEGLIDPLPAADIPNLAHVYPRFLLEGGYGSAFAVSWASLFGKAGLEQDFHSFAQLWDARFRKRYLMTTPQYTQSLFMLIVAAALATGKPLHEAQYVADSGWPHLAELKPNVLTFYTSESMVTMIPQGQADIAGIEYSKAINPYTAKGVPVSMLRLKEGAFTGINSITMPKNAPNRTLGAAFINRLLDPAVQQELAEGTLAAPPVAGLNFKPDIARFLAYPDTKMADMGLFTPDWNYIIPHRSAWVEKYNETFGS
jgi:putative spermidine/putrescine transport system substrate-binding protein